MDLMSRLDRPETARNPYSFYATLRQNAAAHWSESLKGWALFRYADCTSALSDPNLKAERMESVLRTKFPGEELPPDDIYHRFTKNVMMYADPPKHTALRRSTNPAFTRAAHEHYSAVIREVARDLVGSLPPGPREIDGVADLCARLPVMAAVRAFGLPEEDLDVVLPIIETIMTYWSGPKTQPMPLRDVLGALTELHTYARELVEGRRGKVLPDTVIARLVAAQVDNTDTTPEQTTRDIFTEPESTTPSTLCVTNSSSKNCAPGVQRGPL